MSNADSSGPGRGKPNSGYYQDQHAGAAQDPSPHFVAPYVGVQGQAYQPRMPQNQMHQHQYQQPYQPQYNQYNHYQQQHTQPPPQMHQQQYSGYPRQEYAPQQQMYNQNYQYQGPPQHYHQNDTVTYPQSSQPPMTTPAQQEKKRERKLLEIVDPNTNKKVEVAPHQPPAPVVAAAPAVGPDDEKKKLDVCRDFTEQVRKRLTSTTTDDGAPSKSPNAQQQAPTGLPNFSVPPPVIVQNAAQPSSPAVVPASRAAPPAPLTPEAPAKKVETSVPQPEHVTPVSSPQASEITDTKIVKKVRALLNKVSTTSQQTFNAQFISYNVSSNETQLSQVVEIVFDKAVEEPKFCALYAEMCKAQVNHELTKNNGESAFRNTILTRTQAFFQDKRDIDGEKLAIIEKMEDPVKREAMLIEEKQKFRRRKFGVMAFIGYLYRNTLLSTKIVQVCFMELFASVLPKKIEDKEQPLKAEDVVEESVHCGLQLINTVGVVLDEDMGPAFLDQCFGKLEAAKTFFSYTVHFMILRLVELRNDKWIPRKSTGSGPKKIDEIHKDIRNEKIENEERAKLQVTTDVRRFINLRERRNCIEKLTDLFRESKTDKKFWMKVRKTLDKHGIGSQDDGILVAIAIFQATENISINLSIADNVYKQSKSLETLLIGFICKLFSFTPNDEVALTNSAALFQKVVAGKSFFKPKPFFNDRFSRMNTAEEPEFYKNFISLLSKNQNTLSMMESINELFDVI